MPEKFQMVALTVVVCGFPLILAVKALHDGFGCRAHPECADIMGTCLNQFLLDIGRAGIEGNWVFVVVKLVEFSPIFLASLVKETGPGGSTGIGRDRFRVTGG